MPTYFTNHVTFSVVQSHVPYYFIAQMNDLEPELERRTVTYTLWNQSAATNMEKGWHPFTFSYAKANPKRINEIKVCAKC